MPYAEPALIVATILFFLGALGVILRRDLLFILMSLEIMMNAVGLAFIAGSSIHGNPDGQIFFIFILPVAAAEVSIGLALALLIYRKFRTLDVWSLADASGE